MIVQGTNKAKQVSFKIPTLWKRVRQERYLPNSNAPRVYYSALYKKTRLTPTARTLPGVHSTSEGSRRGCTSGTPQGSDAQGAPWTDPQSWDSVWALRTHVLLTVHAQVTNELSSQ